MSKPDVHGGSILELLRSTDRPLLMTEVAEQVGCSKARAYAWLEQNRGLVVAVAKKGRGGAAYMARDNVHRAAEAQKVTEPNTQDKLDNASITIGTRLTVVGMALIEGSVRLELRSDGGHYLVADVHSGVGPVNPVT